MKRSSAEAGRGPRRWIARLGLVLFGFTIALAVSEALLRQTRFRALLDVPLRYYFRADPDTGFDIQENAPQRLHSFSDLEYPVWSNELGCFDDPYQNETRTILLLGDSFTHYYAPFEDKWGTRLQSLLGIRVLKCGVGGFGTRQALLKARKLIPRLAAPPRWIVLGYFWNDFRNDYLFPESTVVDGWPIRTVRLLDSKTGLRGPEPQKHQFHAWLRTRLVLYNLLKQPFERRTQAGDPASFYTAPDPWIAPALRSHFQNLRELADLARQSGGRLLVVLIPSKEQVYPFLYADPPTSSQFPANRLVLDFLASENIEALDLLPQFSRHADPRPRKALDPKQDLYWATDGHWSIPGNHLAAELVASQIRSRNLLGPETTP